MSEKIEFLDLRQIFESDDEETFDLYLEEFYNDLSNNKTTNVTSSTFNNFLTNVPIFICEKIFSAFDRENKGYLSFEEFIDPIKILKYSPFIHTAKIVFEIYDFDKDDKINTSDIILLLSYLPLKYNNEKIKYKFQMESIDDLTTLINETFKNKKVDITFEEFINVIEKKANVFLYLLCYLYLSIPVYEKSLGLYKIKTLKNPFRRSDSNSSYLNSPHLDFKQTPDIMSRLNGKDQRKSLSIIQTNFSPIDTLRSKITTKLSNTPKSTHFRPRIDKVKNMSQFKRDYLHKITKKTSKILNSGELKKSSKSKESKETNKPIDNYMDKERRSKDVEDQKENNEVTQKVQDIDNKESNKSFKSKSSTRLKKLNSQDIDKALRESNEKNDEMKHSVKIYSSNFLKKERYNVDDNGIKFNFPKLKDNELTFLTEEEAYKQVSQVSNKQNSISTIIFADDFEDSDKTKKSNNNYSNKYNSNKEDNDKLHYSLEEMHKNLLYEGELLKIEKGSGTGSASKKTKITEQYMTILDKNIYYYKNKNAEKDAYTKSRFLVGCFFHQNIEEYFNGKFYSSFTILMPDKTELKYYHTDQKIILKWIKYLRKAIGYRDFFSYYKLVKSIGEGQFGVVKLAINFFTNEYVAVKIMKKSEIKTKEDWDLIKTEIDIMRISVHPNVVRFIDNFENSYNIFIVMEYLKSGTLQEYLIEKDFMCGEKTCAHIAFQLADVLKYLHKFGIIHRDLKPENIMLANKPKDDDDIVIKIMDFGLSKILGNQERTTEGYGTLAFLAPEVILKKPYNNSVDIWSLGVITYFMLSGEIPFFTDKEKETRESFKKKIINDKLKFSNKFKKFSKEVLDLILNCLVKEPSKRITIEKLLNHSWFKLKK